MTAIVVSAPIAAGTAVCVQASRTAPARVRPAAANRL